MGHDVISAIDYIALPTDVVKTECKSKLYIREKSPRYVQASHKSSLCKLTCDFVITNITYLNTKKQTPRNQKQYKSLTQSCTVIAKEEGIKALWKGITPRLMRIMPGQAITFMTYEAVSARMEKLGWFD